MMGLQIDHGPHTTYIRLINCFRPGGVGDIPRPATPRHVICTPISHLLAIPAAIAMSRLLLKSALLTADT